MSDFGRLRSYEHFLIPVHALVWTALRNQLAGDVLNLLDYRLRCKHYFCHLIAALSIVISWLVLSSTPQSTDDTNFYGQKIKFNSNSSEPSMDGACLTTFSYLNFTNYSIYIE
jgi:hypothetical protein